MKRHSIRRDGLRARGGTPRSTGIRARGLDRVSDHLGGVGAAIPNESGALKVAWAAAVGSGLARRTRLAGMIGRRLLVEVPDSEWQRAVQANFKRIRDRLQISLGRRAPTFIEVQVAPNMVVPAHEEALDDEYRGRAVAEGESCPEGLLDTVGDEALRGAIARAYRAHQRRYRDDDPEPDEHGGSSSD